MESSQRASTVLSDAPAAIENEIPSYRAISPLAVGSLLFALLSALSYANIAFLAAALAAIVFGVLAVRTIKSQSDVYTGLGIAHAGIALGIVCGLSSVTLSFMQSYVTSRGAQQFATSQLLKVLQDRDLDAALWYRLPPDQRRGVPPEEARKKMEDPAAPTPVTFEMTAGKIVGLIRELKAEPDARAEFAHIERVGMNGTAPVAVVVFRFNWPVEDGNHKHEQKGLPVERAEYLAAVLKCKREGRTDMWWVEDYVYPYKPNSYVEKAKPVDDGHGH